MSRTPKCNVYNTEDNLLYRTEKRREQAVAVQGNIHNEKISKKRTLHEDTDLQLTSLNHNS